MAQPPGKTRPQIGYIGLPDQRSAGAVPTWNYVLGLCQLALGVSVAELEALLTEYQRTDAIQPILDPTAYRDQMRHIPQHREITEAVLHLRRTIARVTEREQGQREG